MARRFKFGMIFSVRSVISISLAPASLRYFFEIANVLVEIGDAHAGQGNAGNSFFKIRHLGSRFWFKNVKRDKSAAWFKLFHNFTDDELFILTIADSFDAKNYVKRIIFEILKVVIVAFDESDVFWNLIFEKVTVWNVECSE